MAEPIVRGSRKFNLWRWILAGIVAVFVIFTVANWSGGDEAGTAVGEVDVVEGQQAAPAPSNGGPIRDSSQIAGVAPETLVGRRVELEGMTVAAVTGDRTFWAKPRGAEGELFVVLLESNRGWPGRRRAGVCRQ